MDKVMLLKHIAEVERRITASAERIRSQQELVRGLASVGRDTAHLEGMLRLFKTARSMDVAESERLQAELRQLVDAD